MYGRDRRNYSSDMARLLARLRTAEVLGAPLGDLAMAVVLALFGLVDTVFTGQMQWLDQWRGPRLINGIVVPLIALALTWRRRFPLTVLTIVLGGMVSLSLAYGASQTTSNVFVSAIAIYSAAVYGRSLLLAAVLIAVGVAIRDAHDPAIVTFGEHLWSGLFAALAFLVGLATRQRQARALTLEERAAAVEQEQRQRAEEAAEEERRRIARELHDIISHSLGVVVLQAGAAEQVLDHDPQRARAVLETIRTTGLEAIGEMSRLLGLIRHDAPAFREPQPSLADIDAMVASMRDAGLQVDLVIHGQPDHPLPAAVELSVFRIVQEGLTNALKHAGTGPVRASLTFSGQEVAVEIADDGAGPAAGRGARLGLIGMRERVAVFGGCLDAGPRPDGGWTLRATLPVTS
jgi:signal transduction histidine kinase